MLVFINLDEVYQINILWSDNLLETWIHVSMIECELIDKDYVFNMMNMIIRIDVRL